jgi:hypothetical protein
VLEFVPLTLGALLGFSSAAGGRRLVGVLIGAALVGALVAVASGEAAREPLLVLWDAAQAAIAAVAGAKLARRLALGRS